MFFDNNYIYYITIGLQCICVIHCIRYNKTNPWIWLIIFLPLIGCIAYFFSEIVNRGQVNQFSNGLGSLFNPSGSVRSLEERLKFSDTFDNKIALADAYLRTGQTEKAIAIYEQSLTGVFSENEYVLNRLVLAYAETEMYESILPVIEKLYKLPQFPRSKSHLLYARALEKTGHTAQAEKEYLRMNGRYTDFEARYHYGLFLLQLQRNDDAYQVFDAMAAEFHHLTPREKRANRTWIMQAREELKKFRHEV